MSRLFLGSTFLVALSMTYATPLHAGDRLEQGNPIGPFSVTKLAGADDDGIEVGQSLCYRCRYGSRPMVLIFARDSTDELVKLIREVESLTLQHAAANLKSLVTLVGSDREAIRSRAEALAKLSGVTEIPFAVSNDGEYGPGHYGLNESSEVVVVVANDSQTVASFAFTDDEIDTSKVLAAIQDLLK